MTTTFSPVAVGALRLVAHDGDRRRLRGAAVNDEGDILLCTRPGTLTLISAGGEHVIARARTIGGLDLAEGGRCLYRADGGLYLSTPDGTTRIGHGYHGFAQPTLVAWESEGGPRHLAAYVARRPDGHKVAVLHPSHAEPVECFATGTTIAGDLVEDFRISRLGLALCCVATLRGEHGRRYRKALIVDAGNAISGDRIVEGDRIARLATRSAVNVQLGFVKARLHDGTEVLYSRPPLMAEPEVLLRTGDSLPGAGRVSRIGAPVSGSGIPNTGRFGLAAAVRLDDGRRAVWLAVFGAQHPLHGRAIAALLDGDHPDDEHPDDEQNALPLRDFVPIKLTNRGALLAWARTDTGRALVLAEGLFDWYETPGPMPDR